MNSQKLKEALEALDQLDNRGCENYREILLKFISRKLTETISDQEKRIERLEALNKPAEGVGGFGSTG